jgi:hypothetical protein
MPLKWNMSITKLQHNLIDIHVYEEENSCKHEGLWILVRNSSPLLTYITVLLELKKQNHGSSSFNKGNIIFAWCRICTKTKLPMLRLNTNYDYQELFLKYNNLNIKIDAIDGISKVITSGVTASFVLSNLRIRIIFLVSSNFSFPSWFTLYMIIFVFIYA